MAVADNKTRVMITLEKEIVEILKEKAKLEHRSLSNYIETILIKSLDDNK